MGVARCHAHACVRARFVAAGDPFHNEELLLWSVQLNAKCEYCLMTYLTVCMSLDPIWQFYIIYTSYVELLGIHVHHMYVHHMFLDKHIQLSFH